VEDGQPITAEALRYAVWQISDAELSNTILDVLIFVFDRDRSGSIEAKELREFINLSIADGKRTRKTNFFECVREALT
jgi:Ca2+-binding EF-hand superfamily protein